MSAPYDICLACGWGCQPRCPNIETAVLCKLNWENRRKFALRYKNVDTPVLVRSVRYMGNEGKGDSDEQLVEVNMAELRAMGL
jgi:hypothetical protein